MPTISGTLSTSHERVADQASLDLPPQDPGDRLVEPVPTDLALVDGCEERLVRDVELRWAQQHVDAGQDREDHNPVVAVLVTDALHPQRVGDDHPVEAELAAQDAGHDRVRQGRGVAGRVELGHHQVTRHDRADARLDRVPERRSIDVLPLLPGVGDDGDAGVAVHTGVAVARKVLGGGQDAGVALVSLDLSRGEGPHEAGFRAVRPYADHRVGGVDVDVGDRCVVLVDADCGELTTGDGRGAPGGVDPALGAERHVAWELRGRRTDPHDRPLLLVGGDEERQAAHPSRPTSAAGRWTGWRPAPGRRRCPTR